VSLQDDKFKMFLLLIKDVTDLSKAKAQQLKKVNKQDIYENCLWHEFQSN